MQDLLYETPIPDTARHAVVGIVKNGLFLFNKIVTRCHQVVDQPLTSNTDVQSNIFMLEGSSVSLRLQKAQMPFGRAIPAHLGAKKGTSLKVQDE